MKDLEEKIKSGILKSGFPLEMRTGRILDTLGWVNVIGRLYKDYTTDKIREIDLEAIKQINGIAFNILIACKKSKESQLILYTPQIRFPTSLRTHSTYLTSFPKVDFFKERQFGYSADSVMHAMKDLYLFNNDFNLSKKLIVTRGDKQSDENIQYLSAIDGLIKRSIRIGSDGFVETGFRTIFLYVMVFDGLMYSLTPSINEPFELKKIEYGKLFHSVEHKVSGNDSLSISKDILETGLKFGNNFIVEIMTPEFFEEYMQNLIAVFTGIDKNLLRNWGKGWDEHPASRKY